MVWPRRNKSSGRYGHGSYDYDVTTKTKVSITWDNKSSTYAIKFHDTKHWTEMQQLISWMKKLPHNTDRYYDETLKTWFLIEKHIEPLKTLFEIYKTQFEVDFIERTTNDTTNNSFYSEKFTPTAVLLESFNKYAGVSVTGLEYKEARSIYRSLVKKYHPDYNPANLYAAQQMADINSIWSQLEIQHFKVKEKPTQETVNV